MAEPHTPPELQLKELLNSYPSLDDTSPSSWFVWSDDPNLSPKWAYNKVCHADLRYHSKGFDHLVTAVPNAEKISLKYLRMLTHGPFRAFSDLISLKRFKDQYYLQCDELKKWPAPVLFNFCIASRAPIEFEEYLVGWSDLLDAGYPEVLAFLMSQSMAGGKFKTARQFPDLGHHWFDPSSDWRKIIDGTPYLSANNYHDHPQCVTPSNIIWGSSQDYKVIRNLDDVKTAEYFGFKFPPLKPERPKVNRIYTNLPKWAQEFPIAPPPNAEAVGQAQQVINQMLHQAPNGDWVPAPQPVQAPGAQPAPLNWVIQNQVEADPDVNWNDDDVDDDFPDFEPEDNANDDD